VGGGLASFNAYEDLEVIVSGGDGTAIASVGRSRSDLVLGQATISGGL
jgi:hypothetical protein